ncbi:MAG: outer membrane lipoprotein carrier protein LolA [Bacteroidales bacterium]|nr:outer membrane lipoprotein carrier protein LolA [Bacteroidales bacterium]
MNRVFVLLSAFLLPLPVSFSQQDDPAQDPYAGEILERSAAKISKSGSIEADFELVIEDRKEDLKHATTGNILIRQDRYKLNSSGNTVIFDGKTMWTYTSEFNEVIITEPDPSDDDFLANPASIFTWYDRDFKYRYLGETRIQGVHYHEIDLFPKNLNQPYSRIKLFINRDTLIPEIITSIGKDGVDYTVNLTNILTGKDVPDDTFVFDPEQYRKIEVVDMRGAK